MKISSADTIKFLLVVLLIGTFGIFYWQTVILLPLFGDATIHGKNANDVLNGGWRMLAAEYPGLYTYLMAIFFTFFGEKGYNFVPYSGLLFLLLSIFLLIRQVTKNYYLSLFSIIIVACSPKIIFYSARMYQEILISAMFILNIFLLFKYLENKKIQTLSLVIFFLGINLSIKQQGFFILYPSILILFLINLIRKKISFLNFISMVLCPLLIGIGFYGVLFHNQGVLNPGSEEVSILRIINRIGQRVFLFNKDNNSSSKIFTPTEYVEKNIKDDKALRNELIRIEEEKKLFAFTRAENRHIWPTEVFTNFDKFNQANSLYLNWQGRKVENVFIVYIYFFCLILGILFVLINYKRYSNILIFSATFLLINYLLFSRNTDQPRYQLFLSLYLLIFSFLFMQKILVRVKLNNRLLILVPPLFIIILLLPMLISWTDLNKRWVNSQLYSSSVGGIETVKETGYWLQDNISRDALLGQQCSNETKYYSDREIIGDWRVYFLSLENLRTFFQKNKISYYVVNKSQIIPDDKWTTVCWVPESFYDRIDANFKRVYTSSKEDIYVYDTENTIN